MSLNQLYQVLSHEISLGEEARDAMVQHIDKTAEVLARTHQEQAVAIADLRAVIIQSAIDRGNAIRKAIGDAEPKRLEGE